MPPSPLPAAVNRHSSHTAAIRGHEHLGDSGGSSVRGLFPGFFLNYFTSLNSRREFTAVVLTVFSPLDRDAAVLAALREFKGTSQVFDSQLVSSLFGRDTFQNGFRFASILGKLPTNVEYGFACLPPDNYGIVVEQQFHRNIRSAFRRYDRYALRVRAMYPANDIVTIHANLHQLAAFYDPLPFWLIRSRFHAQ